MFVLIFTNVKKVYYHFYDYDKLILLCNQENDLTEVAKILSQLEINWMEFLIRHRLLQDIV